MIKSLCHCIDQTAFLRAQLQFFQGKVISFAPGSSDHKDRCIGIFPCLGHIQLADGHFFMIAVLSIPSLVRLIKGIIICNTCCRKRIIKSDHGIRLDRSRTGTAIIRIDRCASKDTDSLLCCKWQHPVFIFQKNDALCFDLLCHL